MHYHNAKQAAQLSASAATASAVMPAELLTVPLGMHAPQMHVDPAVAIIAI